MPIQLQTVEIVKETTDVAKVELGAFENSVADAGKRRKELAMKALDARMALRDKN